ncbi:hypothetical protein CDL12_22553 [Handroanthus impetiginosus]|uniref:Pectinesterase inhibitor domain-containing protein n=1 Tax=Handroanthus impetiginosus TaxID=429701 RepID=A0A2G9GI72_9LAMI|nr:hypothetical protein CDL12_22553 [Handroanthus impetiginosus]
MAIPIYKSYSCTYLLIFLFLISGIFFASATPVEDVCHRTHDEAFCRTVLGSDPPRTQTAGLHELGQIVIDMASRIATDAKAKILSLSSSAKDPKLIKDLKMCGVYYGDALTSVKAATNYLNRGEYGDLNVNAGAVNGDALNCEALFQEPPTRKSPLTSENDDLERFGEILEVISNLLPSTEYNPPQKSGYLEKRYKTAHLQFILFVTLLF